MPGLLDKILRRTPPTEEPTGLYSPPERGAADPAPSAFNVGDRVRAAGRDSSGAAAVADGVRRPMPGNFTVPDGVVGEVRGVDLDKLFVAFPLKVPTTPWRHARGGPDFQPGDRLKAVSSVPSAYGVIPSGHVAVVNGVGDDELEVTLMLQFTKKDWMNTQLPDERRWGSRNPGDEPARAAATWKGLNIAVEYFAGEPRPPADRIVPASYGYFEDTRAMDGDGVDVMLGPDWNDETLPVHVVEQLDPRGSGETFQFKTLLGFESPEEAADTFLELWPSRMLGEVEQVSVEEFLRDWLPVLDVSRRQAAGIVDLQGIDGRVAQELAARAFEDSGLGSFEDAVRRIQRGMPLALGSLLEGDVLRTDEANAQFNRAELFPIVGEVDEAAGYFRAAPANEPAQVILNLSPLLLQDAARLTESKLARRIRAVLAHELRHLADWAYRGTAAFSRENPDLLSALQRDEEGRISDPDAYVNSPTELRSWAGNAAEALFAIYGADVQQLSGLALVRSLKEDFGVWLRIRPENRRDFLQRVLQALEQLISHETSS